MSPSSNASLTRSDVLPRVVFTWRKGPYTIIVSPGHLQSKITTLDSDRLTQFWPLLKPPHGVQFNFTDESSLWYVHLRDKPTWASCWRNSFKLLFMAPQRRWVRESTPPKCINQSESRAVIFVDRYQHERQTLWKHQEPSSFQVCWNQVNSCREVNKSNANVAKYARRVNLRGK